MENTKTINNASGSPNAGKFFNKIFAFFSNKWTRFAFSFVSAGYVLFLVWVTHLTFAYHFIYDNAAALFILYTFINVMFAIVMMYTRRCMVTKIATLLMHPIILVLLIYGFGNWFLFLPPFIAATVVFFASRVNESLKVILGTIYMILFVLAFLAYITLDTLTIKVPLKMDLHLREYPNPKAIEIADNRKKSDGEIPFRLVAYVDAETKENRRANFYIERTDLDKHFWNLTCERVSKTADERAGTLKYCENVFGDMKGKPSYELKWEFGDRKSLLNFGGRELEIDKEGRKIVVEIEEEDDEDEETPAVTRKKQE